MEKLVLKINGSPRLNGNTSKALDIAGRRLEARGIRVERIQLGGMLLRGCQGCRWCRQNPVKRCVFDDDGLNEILEKVWAADGLLIGSPTYYSNVTTEVKAFIDRCGFVSGSNGGLLKGKIGAPVVSVRRSGGNFVYAAINYLFGISQMPIATSSYWNMTLSLGPNDIVNDEEGIRTFETLGDNMAEMVLKLR
ncbi:MAG: flavodoxin family protein [Christensenellales bacterium]